MAISRAMDELYLTYPILLQRGSWSGAYLAKPSRFVTEVDPALIEPATLEHEDER